MGEHSGLKSAADLLPSEEERKVKVAAICTSCGAAYAAEKWSTGKIRPIGRRAGCRCGGDEFTVAGEPGTTGCE